MTSKETFDYFRRYFIPGRFDEVVERVIKKSEVTFASEAKEVFFKRILKQFGLKVLNECKSCSNICDDPCWLYLENSPSSYIINTPCGNFIKTERGKNLNKMIKKSQRIFK